MHESGKAEGIWLLPYFSTFSGATGGLEKVMASKLWNWNLVMLELEKILIQNLAVILFSGFLFF